MMPALASIQVPQAVKQLDKDYRLETSENERLVRFYQKCCKCGSGKYLDGA